MNAAQQMFTDRQPIQARWVAVMAHRRHDRGIRPAPWQTRCLLKGEIHEILLCTPGPPEDPINEICYLGFAEVTVPGVIVIGDDVGLPNGRVGVVHGFDETHMPNHYNILVRAGRALATGADLHLAVGDLLTVAAP
jgi:hypothetical protein